MIFPMARLSNPLLVLQRPFRFPTSPPQFFASSLFVSEFCDAVSLHAPVAPREDFGFVPVADVDEVFEDLRAPGGRLSAVFFPQPVALQHQERQRQQGQRRMVMPADQAAGFVFVEATFAFAGLDVLLDGPPQRPLRGDLPERDICGCVRAVGFQLRFLAERASQQQPFRLLGGQAFFRKPHRQFGVFVDDRSLTAFADGEG